VEPSPSVCPEDLAPTMRFPLSLTLKIARTILKNRLRGTRKFATVLQLEPLHACNLACTGCGRIREYSTHLKEMMPLAECLSAAAECDAPMVSCRAVVNQSTVQQA